MPYREKQMFEIAEFLMANHKPINFNLIAKYSLTEADFVVNKKPIFAIPQTAKQSPINEQAQPVKQVTIANQTITSNIEDTAIYKALKEYRLNTSRTENIKPYFIFNNEEMESIIQTNPKTKAELLSCKGFGEKKYEKYGIAILEILKNNH